ncbi:LOW QUALITY PROTEIN: S100P-binding protein [Chlamydotis macqueenii]
MDGRSPHAFARCLCDRFKPAVHRAAPGAKRPLDSAEQVQALQSAKKACVRSHQCSTPDPSGKLLLCSHGSPCFQGASRFLDDAGREDLVASSAASEYNDGAVSVGTTRCSDDSEPDDSLLELSDSEEENSPFSYTEEEIQEILADDCLESEPYLTRKSTLSQSVNGESAKDESGSCTGVSVISGDARLAAEKPNDPLSRASSSLGSECCPGLPKASASSGENHLRPAQTRAPRMFFDLGVRELLSIGSVDQPLEDNCLEEAEREASEAIINDCLEYDKAAGSCVLRESSEGLMPDGRQRRGVGCLGRTPFASRVSGFCGDRVERSVPSSAPACGRSTADESSAPVVPSCPSPSSGSRNQELPKARASCFSRKLDSAEEEEGESGEAEPPSNSIEVSDTAVGQTAQEEITSGKKPGKVIPVPQEEEERLKQQTGVLEAELEQKKHLCAECAHPCEEDSSCYPRNYPRPNKKPTRRYNLTQWVSKDLAKHRYFQSIPDHFQRSPVTTFSNV